MSPLYFTLKTQIERLKCELTDAKAEIQHLQRSQHSSSPDDEEEDPILRCGSG